MKKFYLVYLVVSTVLFLSYIVADILTSYTMYDIWTDYIGNYYTPLILTYTVPAAICLISALVALAVGRPKLAKYRWKDAAIDIPIVIVPAAIGYFMLIITQFPKTPAYFHNIYSLLYIGCGALAGILIMLVRHILRSKEKTKVAAEEHDTNRAPVSFGSAFFTVTTIVSILPFLLAIILVDRAWDQYPGDELTLVFIWFTIMVVAGVLGYYFTEKLYKKNVFASFLIFALCFCAFVGGCFAFFLSTWDCTSDNPLFDDYSQYQFHVDREHGPKPDYHYSDDDRNYYDDYDGDDYPDGYYGDGELWDTETFQPVTADGDNDHDMVSRALSFARNFIDLTNFPESFHYDLTGYSYYSPGMMDDEYGSHDYYYITRHLFMNSPQISITRILDRYMPTLTEAITRSVYHDGNSYGKIVELLIAAYDDLYEEDDDGWGDNFNAVYLLMTEDITKAECTDEDGKDLTWMDVYYNRLEARGLVSPEELWRFNDGDYNVDVPLLVWTYSFWGRRYEESTANPGDIYNALNMLKEIYD